MRAVFFYTLVSAQLLGLVVAQAANAASLPSCAIMCLGEADMGSCSAFDSKCLCTKTSFTDSVLSCAQNKCKGGDLPAAQNMMKALCHVVGVSITVPAPSSTSSAKPSSASSAQASATPSVPPMKLPECGTTCVRLNGKKNAKSAVACEARELSDIFSCLMKGCEAKDMGDSINAIATHCAEVRNPGLVSVASSASSTAQSSSATSSSGAPSSSAAPSPAPPSSAKPSSGTPSSASSSSAKPSSGAAAAPKPTIPTTPGSKDTAPNKAAPSASPSPSGNNGNGAAQASPASVAGLTAMFVGLLAFCVYL